MTETYVSYKDRVIASANKILAQEFLSFGELLCAYRERARMSQMALANMSYVDHSYINRLEAGDRDPPKRDKVDSFVKVLKLSKKEENRFVAAAGFAPPGIQGIGSWDDAVQAYCDVMASDVVPQDKKDEFCLAVTLLADDFSLVTKVINGNWKKRLRPPR